MSQDKPGSAESHVCDVNQAEEIYRSCASELIRYANALVGPSDAADVVSSAFLKALGSRGWSSIENHRAYLYRAVLNEVRSQYRSNMRRQVRELRVVSPEAVTDPEPRPDVLEALGRLSPMQRAVAYLFYMEDMDESSVADTLQIGRGSVRKHLGRARDKLRQFLDV